MPKQQKSRAARTEYVRNWRRNTSERKRFNNPLKDYIELKYNALYSEYCSFFKYLDERHPQDLTKTSTYKRWKRELMGQQQENEPSTSHEQESEADEAAEPSNGYLDNVDNVIREIINELEQDEAVRNLLAERDALGDDELVIPHYVEHDEGIGLNLEDELEDIFEPFDFQEEVEPFDF